MKKAIVFLMLLCATISAAEFDVPSKHSFSASTMYRYAKLDKPYHGGGPYATAGGGAIRESKVINAYKYHSTAMAVAYQYKQSLWSAGFSLGYESGRVTQDVQMFVPASYWNNSTNKAKSETFGLTLFGARKFSEWTIKGNTFIGGRRFHDFYGWAGWHTKWGDPGDDWGTQAAASLEISRSFYLPSELTVTPYAGLDFSHSPSISMELFEMKSHNYTEIPLGVRMAKSFTAGDWTITPSADATFITSIGHIRDQAYNRHYGYAARTGAGWKVYGVAADHWGGRIKAGMDATFRDRFNAGIHYTFEGRDHYKDHRIEASLGLAF